MKINHRATGDYSMTTTELLAKAESTYPPTEIVLRTVMGRVGTGAEIAELLHLGENGQRRVRQWVRHETIPFPCWLALLILDDCEK